jgi:signal transduction histidine kinase/ligand-binding sensor domain-containing protein
LLIHRYPIKMKLLFNYHITILICLLFLLNGKAQRKVVAKTIMPFQDEYIIDSWDIEKGLPVNGGNVLAQTKDGYLWLGSEEGLIRYSGSDFVVFNSKNTPAFKDSFITGLDSGFGDILWIGTRTGGLIKYYNKKFTVYNIPELYNKQINALITDKKGNVWIGGAETGLIKFDGVKAKVYTTSDGLINNDIKSLFQDVNGYIWIGTVNGLSLFDSREFLNSVISNSSKVNYFRSICAAPEGNGVWVGTNGDGIFYARIVGKSKNITLTPLELNHMLPNSSISNLISDKESVWIGMYGGGVSNFNFKSHKLSNINSKNGLPCDLTRTMFKDKEKNIWIGSFSGGIFKLKKKKHIFMLDKKSGLESEILLPVMCDSKGSIWIGTTEKGVYQYTKGKVKHFGTGEGLSSNNILSIAEGDNGIIWVGTSGGGLNKIDGNKITIIKDPVRQRNIVTAILNDPGKGVWVGTDGGGLNYLKNGTLQPYFQEAGLQTQKIFYLLKQNKRLWIATDGNGLQYVEDGKHYTISKKSGLNSNSILDILPDKDGGLWIVTLGSGINYLKDGKATVITSKNGLFDDNIMQLIPDKLGNAWIGSNNGIAKISFNELRDFVKGKIKTIHSTVYGVDDGMNSMECNGGSMPPGCVTPDGIVCFPTAKGLAMFDPGIMHTEHTDFNVEIEKVLVNNEETEINKPIKLSSEINYLEIHYAAITFTDPGKINYQYKLDGFDKEWQSVGKRRVAYFTNLEPGKYSFKVRASGSDEVWIESKDVFQFSIPLPFYRSYWFFAGIVLLVFLIVIIYTSIRSRHLKGIELERLVEERTAELKQEIIKREKLGEALLIAKEAAEESSNMKSSLLANMSHELRTPMNGILGFSELLSESLTDEAHKVMAHHIWKSGERLMNTLNTVLDLSMLESGNLQIVNQDLIIGDIITAVTEPYLDVLQSKNIKLVLNNPEDLKVCADGKIIERIISYLFDNAIKFTHVGSISISSKAFLKEDKRWISISIDDTGLGIPKDKYQIIFKEFRQVSEGYGRSQEGTGLGLSLSLKMARLIGGDIAMHSELNKGSSFELVFPDFNLDTEVKEVVNHISPLLNASDGNKISVLVVEDNIINIDLILKYIPDSFNVVVAQNGYQAVSKASQQSFHLILMDINLGPGMNGIETLKEIKKMKDYSDVPVIAVTGYSDVVPQMSENTLLFDAIITKPFSKNELMNIINGLFKA